MLGDFNNAVLRKWNKTSHKPCPHYHVEYDPSWGLGYKPIEHSQKGHPALDESVDVFGIGGVFYYVLVGTDPYFRYNKGNETAEIEAGKLPPPPRSVARTMTNATTTRVGNDGTVNKNYVFIRAVVGAIGKAMALHPSDRPSAKEMAEYFLLVASATMDAGEV